MLHFKGEKFNKMKFQSTFWAILVCSLLKRAFTYYILVKINDGSGKLKNNFQCASLNDKD
jgi:hypothetical protein